MDGGEGVRTEKWQEPDAVFAQYETGKQFKGGLGTRGLYEQNRINERFFAGDQWHGARCGGERPLVRYNIIKRIGDYKMAVIGAGPVAVNYSADGVPNTVELRQRVRRLREQAAQSAPVSMAELTGEPEEISSADEVNLVMGAMSDYFRVTAERVGFDSLKESALRNAYCSGTGILYTYWDDRVRTGLYADEKRRHAIRGDIACEVLDIENVYFGDPNMESLQEQPYILIAQRLPVGALREEARRNRRPPEEIARIRPDRETAYMAGDMGGGEPEEAQKATVLTKFVRSWDEEAGDYRVRAVRVCRGVTIRREWELGIRLYPFAKFSWERRRNCAYGESEITWLIPNQIAINRMITASVWAVMLMGMPIMVVNGDIVTQPITNDPGQIIQVNGGTEDVERAIRYVNPPGFSPAFDGNIASLIAQTMTQSGANDAALGDVRPDNTSAIIAVREAATMPLQLMQSRFHSFLEDVARIWAEFWVCQYGRRALKVEDESGTWYLPFDGARYRELLISVRTDVGASSLWSESQAIRTLDNLFDRQVIDVVQYLQRLPKGIVPDLSGLIRELEGGGSAAAAEETAEAKAPAREKAPSRAKGPSLGEVTEGEVLAGLSPAGLEMLQRQPRQVQQSLIRAAMDTAARNRG